MLRKIFVVKRTSGNPSLIHTMFRTATFNILGRYIGYKYEIGAGIIRECCAILSNNFLSFCLKFQIGMYLSVQEGRDLGGHLLELYLWYWDIRGGNSLVHFYSCSKVLKR